MTAIVKADEYASGLEQILQVAKSLKQAGGFLPQHLRNEGEIVAVILAGRELGIPPMASIRGIKLVKGNVTLDAAMQLALMVRAGAKVTWLKDGRDGTAQLKLERVGQEPHTSTYSLEDARRAGLSGDNWTKHPAAMLRARCVTAAGKAFMPDVLAGVYLPDELPSDEPARTHEAPENVLDAIAEAPVTKPAAGGQRTETHPTEPARAGSTAASEPGVSVSAEGRTASSHAAGERAVAADGELLDASAWRARYEAEASAAVDAGFPFVGEDELGLPIPGGDEPIIPWKAKQHSGKKYSEVPPGYLREVVVGHKSFAERETGLRLHALYRVCVHELSKEAKDGGQ